MNPNSLRLILVTSLVASYLVAIFLSRRKMPALAYAFRRILASLVPAFGPFCLIAYRPGEMAYRKHGRLRSGSKRRHNIPA